MFPTALHSVACRLHQNGFSIRKVAEYVNATKSTVHRWIQGIAKTRDPKPASSRDAFRFVVNSNPFQTLTDYRRALLGNGDKPVSRTTLSRWMKDIGYTKGRTYPGGLKTSALLEKRHDFTEKAKSLTQDDVVCVDETSWYHTPIARYGWRPKGAKLRVPLIRTTGRRFSLVIAMTRQGDLQWNMKEGSYNAESFAGFISSLPGWYNGKMILMDNVAFHKSRAVRMALTSRGLTSVFTSPYSPEWNAAEMLFSHVKRQQRKATGNTKPQIDALLRDTPKEFCRRWHDHCWRNILAGHHP